VSLIESQIGFQVDQTASLRKGFRGRWLLALIVVLFNSKDYLVSFASSQRPISANELTRDYEEMIKVASMQPGVDGRARVVLSGWSLGAGYSVLVATDPLVRERIDRVVAISLPIYDELAWNPTDALIYITHVNLSPNSIPSRS